MVRMIGELAVLFEVILVVMLVILPAALLGSYVVGNFPVAPKSPIYFIYSFLFGMFDNSFLFIFILVMFADVYRAWTNPTRIKAIENIIAFFMVSYTYVVLATSIIPSFAGLQLNTLLPATSSFFSNPYYIAFTFFIIIICAIFNMKGAS